MAKRLQNPRLAKIHRSYKIDEVANLYNTHKNTVHNWIKSGLSTCDTKRPIMILGTDLNVFHAKQRIKNKNPCKPNEIYCMKCKIPKTPISDLVQYQPINEKTGNLIGICSACETRMNRRISNSKISQFATQMQFTIPLAHLHIINTN